MKLTEHNLHNLVVRIAKALSTVANIKWQLHIINSKPLKFAIINECAEMLYVPLPNEDEVYVNSYEKFLNRIGSNGRVFDSYEEFLTRIISTKFPLQIFDIDGKQTEFIFSERFGKTLDELNITLDMLNI